MRLRDKRENKATWKYIRSYFTFKSRTLVFTALEPIIESFFENKISIESHQKIKKEIIKKNNLKPGSTNEKRDKMK